MKPGNDLGRAGLFPSAHPELAWVCGGVAGSCLSSRTPALTGRATLGPARSRWLCPIASVARTGAVVSGGSDWFVSSLNPLDAIQVGITHRPPDRPAQAAWNPIERVDLATMDRFPERSESTKRD